MNADEAMALLGVDRDTSPDAVRRAYLRACRVYRPETDPAGFQRVRAAYDLLRSFADRLEVDLSHEIVLTMPAPRAEDTSARVLSTPDPLSNHEPEASPPVRPEPTPPPPTTLVPAADAPASQARQEPLGPVESKPSTAAATTQRGPREWLLWLEGHDTDQLLDVTSLDELERCATEVGRVLSELCATGAVRSPTSLALLALTLWARGRNSSARALVAAMRREPLEAPVVGMAIWALTREIEVVGELVMDAVGPMAESLLRLDDTLFFRWFSAQGPFTREACREVLVESAPSLASRFHGILQAFTPTGNQKETATPRWLWAVVMVVVIGGFGMCRNKLPSTMRQAPEVHESAALCSVTPQACEHYEALQHALSRGDCEAGFAAWRAIDTFELRPAMRRTFAALTKACGPLPPAAKDSLRVDPLHPATAPLPNAPQGRPQGPPP